jgi:hypothetical protein
MQTKSHFKKLAYNIASSYGYDGKGCPTFQRIDEDDRKALTAAKLAEYRDASDFFYPAFEILSTGLGKMGEWTNYDDYRQNCIDTMEAALQKTMNSDSMQYIIDDALADAYDHYLTWDADNDKAIKRAEASHHHHI